jgi:hypothetical protein
MAALSCFWQPMAGGASQAAASPPPGFFWKKSKLKRIRNCTIINKYLNSSPLWRVGRQCSASHATHCLQLALKVERDLCIHYVLFLFQDVGYHGDPFLYIQNTEVCARTWVNVTSKWNRQSCNSYLCMIEHCQQMLWIRLVWQ